MRRSFLRFFGCVDLSAAEALNCRVFRREFHPQADDSDGWRQFVILDRGRAFDYLAWYQPLVCKKPVTDKPRLSDATDDLWWELETPKTCPPKHFGGMEIEEIGTLPIDMEKARARFPKTRPGIIFLGGGGRGAAVNDISIGNVMCPAKYDWENYSGSSGSPRRPGLDEPG